MRKRFLFIAVILAVFLAAPYVEAGVSDLDALRLKAKTGDTYQLEVQNSSETRVFSINSTGPVKSIPIPLTSFLYAFSGIVSPVSASTNPILKLSNTYYPGIEFENGVVTPVSALFRLPDNYRTGGTVKLLMTQSAANVAVDFDIFVSTPDVSAAIDTSATDQSPVTINSATTTSPHSVTLTPATDLSSAAAGDWVLLRVWRSTNSSTGTARLHDAEFQYYSYD